MTNAYRDHQAQVTIGESVTPFNNANAHIGVGDSTTAFAATQTDLQAATNKLRKAMDAGFPQRSGNVVTYQATFGSSDANFPWEESAVFNAPSGGVMQQRKVENKGTKAGGTWEYSVVITHNAG
ncbi:MAG: hypothetical protein AB7I23_25260 [Vicinamibacterales bacterium]